MNSHRPIIGISMGDPGGIGPEIIVKSLSLEKVRRAISPLVIGDTRLLNMAAERSGIALSFYSVTRDQINSKLYSDNGDKIPVYQPFEGDGSIEYVLGKISARNGEAAYKCIIAGIELAMAANIDGLCTAPIAKEAMFKAGYKFPGHTELLAEKCGGVPVRMMLAGGGLRVVLQTIHIPLSEVSKNLSGDEIRRTIDMCRQWGRMNLGIDPKIAVCGLNPHAGEGGHFGNEEPLHIAPAIAESAKNGANVSGPYPADTVFFRALQKDFDIVIAMYHDQGLIPVKTLDFHGGVNITVGLPIVRISPDHGTAFEIAGKNLANESSMALALIQAADLSINRKRFLSAGN